MRFIPIANRLFTDGQPVSKLFSFKQLMVHVRIVITRFISTNTLYGQVYLKKLLEDSCLRADQKSDLMFAHVFQLVLKYLKSPILFIY